MIDIDNNITPQTSAADATTDLSIINLHSFNDGDYPKSLSELDSWPVEKEQILVDMINTAKENHVTDTKFKTAFGITFSYTSLSNRLKDRGWVCEWHKVSSPEPPDKEISSPMPSNDNTKILPLSDLKKEEKSRMSLSVSKRIGSEWQSFLSAKCKKNDYVRVLNEAALSEYMKANKDIHFKFLSE